MLEPQVGDGVISPLLSSAVRSAEAEYAITHVNPSYVHVVFLNHCRPWICLFSFFDHLVRASWGSIPRAVDAMPTGLLSIHLVIATSLGLLTIISDEPRGFVLRFGSGIIFSEFDCFFFVCLVFFLFLFFVLFLFIHWKRLKADPWTSNTGSKNSLLTGRNLGQDQGHGEGPYC